MRASTPLLTAPDLRSRLAAIGENAREGLGAGLSGARRRFAGADGRTRLLLSGAVLAGFGAAAVAIHLAGPVIDGVAHTLGHTLDRAVGGVARGEAGAWTLLLGGSALYGFLHALGPGHGKVLVGSVGVGSEVMARRLMTLAFVASLVQSLWAIALVYGALAGLGASARAVSGVARDVLAPAGGAVILAIGTLMVLRATGLLRRAKVAETVHGGCGHAHRDHAHNDHGHGAHGHGHDHRHAHDRNCSCAHGPSLDAVARLERPWDAALLVLGIASRPCTSALLVLALAWQAGVPLAGAIATIAMGLGTAALTCSVAGSSVLARTAARMGGRRIGARRVGTAVKLLAGLVVATLGLMVAGGNV